MSLLGNLLRRPDLAEGIEQAKKTPGAVLLDVRSEEEYREGHVPGSLNLPLDRLAGITIEKDRPLFVYCLSGSRSERACSYLEEVGYTVKNIGGVSGYRGTLVK